MIDALYTYLTNDATLTTLLGGSGSDSKIYPNYNKENDAKKFILYYGSGQNRDTETLTSENYNLEIYADTFSECKAISDRLIVLLDINYQIQTHSDATTNLKTSSMISSDTVRSELEKHEIDQTYAVKYIKY